MIIGKLIVVVLIGYLLGSIPFGLILGKKIAKIDIREFGSGKTGATNMLRAAGKKAAILVGVCDASKGMLAVILAGLIFREDPSLWWLMRGAQALAALAAIAGHTWSIFLNFQGGRGVATFFGGMLALYPPAALLGGEVIFLSVGLTRFVSLGSIAGAVCVYAIMVPLTLYNGFPIEYLGYSLIGTVAIIATHRDNIARLMAGTERRLGEKAKKIISR
ncbi:MAG: glycerol-3-phosphate 1-O-acyltransferase PlsY [Chloroflexota bacterium]